MRDVGPYLPSFGLDRRDGCRVLFRPVNLIGAIVMQFALAVVGNKEYRQCRLERCAVVRGEAVSYTHLTLPTIYSV